MSRDCLGLLGTPDTHVSFPSRLTAVNTALFVCRMKMQVSAEEDHPVYLEAIKIKANL